MKKLNNTRWQNFLTVLVLFFVYLFIFKKHQNLEELPNKSHIWAQTDRLALAHGFIDNGFDFFHPQTFVLNPQFPAKQELANPQGITRVDFPIHEYIVAGIIKVTGDYSSRPFKIYSLIWIFLGMYFLFLLCLKVSHNYAGSLLLTALVYLAPIMIEYQGGFLPSTLSFSVFIIGLYYFFYFQESNLFKHFIWSTVFFTLAALVRTPFGIFLIALACARFLHYLQSKKIIWKEIGALAISFGLCIGYFLYNTYLGKTYGSVFLTYILPFSSWQAVKDVFVKLFITDGFMPTLVHWIVILVLIILAILKREKSNFSFHFLWISLLGCLGYFFLMGQQYFAHNYYTIDTFIPLLAIFLVSLLAKVGKSINRFVALGAVALCFVSSYNVNSNLEANRTDFADTIKANFKGSNEFLTSSGISQDAKLLIFDAGSPNLPAFFTQRKNYVVLNSIHPQDVTDEALDFPFDYAIIQNNLRGKIVHRLPEVTRALERVSGNGLITVYKKRKNREETAIETFMEINRSHIFSEKVDSTEISPYKYYQNLEDTTHYSSAPMSLHYTKEIEFGNNLELLADTLKDVKNELNLLLKAKVLPKDLPEKILLVCDIYNENGQKSYHAVNLIKTTEKVGEWNSVVGTISTLTHLEKGDKMKIYIWNANREEFWLDDLEIQLF